MMGSFLIKTADSPNRSDNPNRSQELNKGKANCSQSKLYFSTEPPE
jgi:hypothetical protein